jgi:hypothetical protein
MIEEIGSCVDGGNLMEISPFNFITYGELAGRVVLPGQVHPLVRQIFY